MRTEKSFRQSWNVVQRVANRRAHRDERLQDSALTQLLSIHQVLFAAFPIENQTHQLDTNIKASAAEFVWDRTKCTATGLREKCEYPREGLTLVRVTGSGIIHIKSSEWIQIVSYGKHRNIPGKTDKSQTAENTAEFQCLNGRLAKNKTSDKYYQAE
jgi:hypothetical protein